MFVIDYVCDEIQTIPVSLCNKYSRYNICMYNCSLCTTFIRSMHGSLRCIGCIGFRGWIGYSGHTRYTGYWDTKIPGCTARDHDAHDGDTNSYFSPGDPVRANALERRRFIAELSYHVTGSDRRLRRYHRFASPGGHTVCRGIITITPIIGVIFTSSSPPPPSSSSSSYSSYSSSSSSL